MSAPSRRVPRSRCSACFGIHYRRLPRAAPFAYGGSRHAPPPPPIPHFPRAEPAMSGTRPVVIAVKNLNKSFGPLRVLKNVNLRVGEGEVIVVLGPSGSGKSTLIRCINRLEPIDSGSIVVDGVRVESPATDIRALRRRIGMVF